MNYVTNCIILISLYARTEEGRCMRMNFHGFYETIGSEYQPVLDRFCNQEAILRRFLLRFPEDCTFQELAGAVREGDSPRIESRAHALKGVAANLGFEQLKELCGELVVCVRNDRLEAVPEIFGRVETEYEHVCHEISMMIEE